MHISDWKNWATTSSILRPGFCLVCAVLIIECTIDKILPFLFLVFRHIFLFLFIRDFLICTVFYLEGIMSLLHFCGDSLTLSCTQYAIHDFSLLVWHVALMGFSRYVKPSYFNPNLSVFPSFLNFIIFVDIFSNYKKYEREVFLLESNTELYTRYVLWNENY